jgi:predicted Fe-Mo cluster-binding NifX family protein
MKVCVTATDGGLDAPLDGRFGRAPYFVFVDTETMESSSERNGAVVEAHGAGISAASNVVASGVQAILTGACGPKAFQVIAAAGVDVYAVGANATTVREAVQAFTDDRLERIAAPNGGRGRRGGW